MLVTFTGVQITIDADGPREAYTVLCDLLKNGADLDTSNAEYEVADESITIDRGDAAELWNSGCDPCEGTGYLHISFDGMEKSGEIQRCDDCYVYDSDEEARAAHDRQHIRCDWALDHEEVIDLDSPQ